MSKIRKNLGKLLLALLCFASVAHAAESSSPTLVVDVRALPVTAAAPVLTSSLTITAPAGRTGSVGYYITVAVVSTDSTFAIDFGSDLAPFTFNNGTALTAGCVYTFAVSATPNDTPNFVFGSTTTVGRLVVEETKVGGR